jgi:hypothetical protein
MCPLVFKTDLQLVGGGEEKHINMFSDWFGLFSPRLKLFSYFQDIFMCIWIINYQPGDIVYQPIIQLFGFDSIYHETILVNRKYQWPVVQGLFKVKNKTIDLVSFSFL